MRQLITHEKAYKPTVNTAPIVAIDKEGHFEVLFVQKVEELVGQLAGPVVKGNGVCIFGGAGVEDGAGLVYGRWHGARDDVWEKGVVEGVERLAGESWRDGRSRGCAWRGWWSCGSSGEVKRIQKNDKEKDTF